MGHWFMLFFGSLVIASAAGGTVHGFFPDGETWGYRILWPTSLIAIGLTAFAAWGAASRILFSKVSANRTSAVAGGLFAAYVAVILTLTQQFWVAIIFYLPATIALSIAFIRLYRDTWESPALTGAAGLGVTLLAPILQMAELSPFPPYLTYNALYHILQAVALWMIFIGASWLVNRE